MSKLKKIIENRIRIPIALHFYSCLILVILLFALTIAIYISIILDSYIQVECTKRIQNAANSCQTFAAALKSSVDKESFETEKDFQEYLLNSIASSADISTDATIALYKLNDDGQHELIWPTNTFSVTSVNNAKDLISKIEEDGNLDSSTEIKNTIVNESQVYYRILGVEYSPSKDVTEDIDYFFCLSVNSNYYRSFTKAFITSLINAITILIVLSGFISVFVSYPLLFSTRKLSKFASRIAKGDFEPVGGIIVSKELSELTDVMNKMAYKLKENDAEQKTFFQNASHELRTPLMSIQGYAEGLKYDVFDEEGKAAAVDVIIDETKRLSDMVENLLSISKMDMSKSGTYEVKKEIVDANQVAGLLIDKVRGNFIHEDKNLINHLSKDKLYIFANENDILRMLENIISNCLRYSEKDVEFNVSKDGNNVLFVISDDGPGISDDVIKHIFERFAKGSDGKHGIGLSLAKSIAEEHKGSIKAYNKETGGAIFEISIPLAHKKDQLSKLNKDGAD